MLALALALVGMVRIAGGEYRPLYATPGTTIHIASFRLDVDPVTRGDYYGAGISDARRPVTGVSWSEARAFCAARGKRLPTVAEWEYAAASQDIQGLLDAYSTRRSPPPPVERGATNALGLRGLHDLVWEWVENPNERFMAEHSHHHGASAGHDMSCAGASFGAADPRNYPAFLRFAVRSGLEPGSRLETLGFRCAA